MNQWYRRSKTPGARIKDKAMVLHRKESLGYSLASNHEECEARGWSVVNGFILLDRRGWRACCKIAVRAPVPGHCPR
jgi:hypothetical protein